MSVETRGNKRLECAKVRVSSPNQRISKVLCVGLPRRLPRVEVYRCQSSFVPDIKADAIVPSSARPELRTNRFYCFELLE